MDGDDEDVIFSNSPLDQHLKGAGFIDFESQPLNTLETSWQEESESPKEIPSVAKRGKFGKLPLLPIKWLFSYFNGWHSEHVALEKKGYAATVLNSGTLNEDDFHFLQRFDPPLFDQEDEDSNEKHNLSNYEDKHTFFWNLGATKCGLSVTTFLVLVGAVMLGSNEFMTLIFPLFKHVAIVCGIVSLVIILIQRYKTRMANDHTRNLQVLKDYTTNVRTFILLARKSINLIQEVELISKGQTLVGTGMPIGMNMINADNHNLYTIYPNLRHCILDNLNSVLEQSCKAVNALISNCARCPEFSNIFTSISTASLESLGLIQTDNESKLSTQHLKSLLSVTACQQSELLSCYLLSLSDQALEDSVKGLQEREHINKLIAGFTDPLQEVTNALKSLQRSYHLHKSAVNFLGDHDLSVKKHEAKPQSGWTPFYTALHSLELHLKAGLTKVQSLQQNIAQREFSNNTVETKDNPEEMESDFKLIKRELDSAISCLQDGHYRLDNLLGKVNTSAPGNFEGNHVVDNIQAPNLSATEQTEASEVCNDEGDYVLEAYTDSYTESFDDRPILTKEDLERESRAREESRHLLVELKNVLLTKSKDPLITDDGFVKPSKKSDTAGMEDNGSNSFNGQVGCGISEPSDENLPLPTSGTVQQKLSAGDLQQVGLPVQQPKFSNQESLIAFSVAAMAAARSRTMGMMEESFGSDDSD